MFLGPAGSTLGANRQQYDGQVVTQQPPLSSISD